MKSRVRRSLPGVAQKHLSELAWWERELRYDVAWYKGERALYGLAPPRPDERKIRGTVEASACVTMVAQRLEYYPETLEVARSHFRGKTILDIGCGPLPFSIGFEDCRIVALDPLVREYEAAGFPLAEFTDRVTFVRGFAEDMPFPSRSFDAVISVNALDHVDDFGRTTREIARVLKENGVLRIQVHYHSPTPLEPQRLTDYEVLKHLGHLGLEKVSEKAPSGRSRDSNSPKPIHENERLVVWANDVRTSAPPAAAS
jgi:ubiquinone/menaquinone biosynthesis C-methylase UbiE